MLRYQVTIGWKAHASSVRVYHCRNVLALETTVAPVWVWLFRHAAPSRKMPPALLGWAGLGCAALLCAVLCRAVLCCAAIYWYCCI